MLVFSADKACIPRGFPNSIDKICYKLTEFIALVPTMDLNTIKAKLTDASQNFRGKSKDNISATKKTLIDAVFSLIDIADSLVSTVERENSYIEKLAKEFTVKTEGMLSKLMERNNIDAKNSECAETSSTEKHVLVVDDLQEDKISPNKWTQVVKSDLSKKLKKMPVSKTVLSKNGKGCIFLPDEKALEDAKQALSENYRVNATTKKPSIILPKIKINNVKADSYESNNDLRNEILAKNSSIKSVLENDANSKIDVIFIDKRNNSAMLKVTPNIREAIMKKQRIYLDLESHHVSDSFHVQQCYHCQSFGHKANSEYCPNKNSNPTCFYCGCAHKSSECFDKDDKSKHKCVNCNKSSNQTIKEGASKHNASSRNCPLYQKEIELIKAKTCYDSKNLQSFVRN